ncbi:MAG: purine-nucleoside phosphorylase [Clostridiales bacterium]|nr:purine-nucleoside phosphorylase [Clostridiales bacterium]
MYTYQDYLEAAQALRERIDPFVPDCLLILGTGVGALAERVEGAVVVPYGEVPHQRVSTNKSHAGNFVFGRLGGRNVMVMQGRLHIYEGYTAEEVAFPVRVARLLGCGDLIVTNAAGAVNYNYRVGDIMLISDQIRLFDPDPLIGPNIEAFGGRWCDMSDVYTEGHRQAARRVASALGMQLREGVYFYFTGPQFETPAEIRAARILGADAIGMSTVPEVIAAAHCGYRILGFSLLTNMAAGMVKRAYVPGEVTETAERVKERFCNLVTGCLEALDKGPQTEAGGM